eukprot:evm.model.scf_1334.3 EVM.evm.TU.scf_1334.3   scf_1334:12118-14439(-)
MTAVQSWQDNYQADFNGTSWRLLANGRAVALDRIERPLPHARFTERGYPERGYPGTTGATLEFQAPALLNLFFPDSCTAPQGPSNDGAALGGEKHGPPQNNSNFSNSYAVGKAVVAGEPEESDKLEKSEESDGTVDIDIPPHGVGGDGDCPTDGGQGGRRALRDWMLEPVEVRLEVADASGAAVLDLGALPLVRQGLRRMANWKVCSYQESGRWFGGNCQTVSYADSLCVKVDRDAAGRWAPSPLYGGPGCSPSLNWQLTHWRRVRLSRGNFTTPVHLPPAAGSSPTLHVISARDPDVTSRNLTAGLDVTSRNLTAGLVSGAVCVVVGAVFLVPAAVLGAPALARMRVRRAAAAKYERFCAYRPGED